MFIHSQLPIFPFSLIIYDCATFCSGLFKSKGNQPLNWQCTRVLRRHVLHACKSLSPRISIEAGYVARQHARMQHHKNDEKNDGPREVTKNTRRCYAKTKCVRSPSKKCQYNPLRFSNLKPDPALS